MGESILYLIFVLGMLGSATAAIFVRTPIHSLLLLIMTFFNTAGLFLVWGAEFLAMALLIIYIGAVAVLFLFVVMMLDIDQRKTKFKFSRYTGFSCVLALIMFVELVIIVLPWKTWEKAIDVIALPIPQMLTNANAIGNCLYTQYFYIFQLSGLIFLIAMVGAILLTKRERPSIKQNTKQQISRKPSETLEMVKVPFHEGIDI
ncbi:MAG: NADH-quinone oxidoreductase subunit J [Pseudomonadota bacterium]|jgi:NADH-quinone oxidoreductase subunit J|nr:NADH-quinone oxidoreductase subunit J [Alphaproteobacteria bacterium]